MLGFDLASLDGETKCSVADANVLGSLAQVHPSFRFAALRLVTRDFIIGSQRDDAFSCPIIFPTGVETGAIQRRSNPIVGTNACQYSYGLHNIFGCLGAILASPPSRSAQLGICTALAVNDQDELTTFRIAIDHD